MKAPRLTGNRARHPATATKASLGTGVPAHQPRPSSTHRQNPAPSRRLPSHVIVSHAVSHAFPIWPYPLARPFVAPAARPLPIVCPVTHRLPTVRQQPAVSQFRQLPVPRRRRPRRGTSTAGARDLGAPGAQDSRFGCPMPTGRTSPTTDHHRPAWQTLRRRAGIDWKSERSPGRKRRPLAWTTAQSAAIDTACAPGRHRQEADRGSAPCRSPAPVAP